jgi:type I restriction enzyme S subunit
MKHWPTKPLGHVLEVSRERIQPLEYPTSSFNYVGLENVEGHTGKLLPYSSTPGAEIKSTKNVFHPGQILFGKLRPYLNKVHLAREKGICSTDIYVLNPRQHQMDAAFASYFLRSPVVLAAVSNAMAGANLPRINEESLLEIPVPVPPLAEQERLVKLLDEADELRKLRTQADRRIADLIPSLFHEMFGSPAINPFDWPVERVGTLFNVKRGGAKCGPFGSALKKHEYVESGIPVWGIPNVLPNQFVEAGSLFISPSKFEELRAYAVEPGDLLFSRAGTVGRICVANPKNNDSIIGTNLVRLALDRKRVVPEFFATLMTHFGAEVGRLRANADEGAYSFMNTTILKTLRIYLPPFKLQEEFAARVSEIRAMQAEQAASRRRLEHLFQSLLHRAFQGEL